MGGDPRVHSIKSCRPLATQTVTKEHQVVQVLKKTSKQNKKPPFSAKLNKVRTTRHAIFFPDLLVFLQLAQKITQIKNSYLSPVKKKQNNLHSQNRKQQRPLSKNRLLSQK